MIVGYRRAATGIALLCGSLVFTSPTLAQQGTVVRVDDAEVTLNGRVQTQFNTTSVDDLPTTDIAIRRVRLDIGVRVNDVVSGNIQPVFMGGDLGFDDAYLQLTFSPAIKLLAGRAHRPFSLFDPISPWFILPIERGIRTRGVDGYDAYAFSNRLGYSDRDTGLQLRGAPVNAPLGFEYAIGYFAGPVHGRTGSNDTWQGVARARIKPAEKVRFGAGWSRRDFVDDSGTDPNLRSGSAYEIDVHIGPELQQPGLQLLGEAIFGTFDPFTGSDLRGAQVWLGYGFGVDGVVSFVEPILRFSHGDVDTGAGALDPGGTLITPGINVYFGGHNRVMLNYDHWSSAEGSSVGSFKAQFQLSF